MIFKKLLLVAAALVCSSLARSNIIYNWNGHCLKGSLCTEAHATIVLDDTYEPGSAVHCNGYDCDVLLWTWGFTYVNGTVEEFSADNRIGQLLSDGMLPVNSGATVFRMGYNTFSDIPMRTCVASNPCSVFTGGGDAWELYGGSAHDGIHDHDNWRPFGDTFNFYRVPEPATPLVFALGLLVVARGRKAAVVTPRLART